MTTLGRMLLLAVFGTAGIVGVSSAKPTHANYTSITHFSGGYANAYFSSDDGCISNSVYVDAGEHAGATQTSMGGPSVNLWVSSWNHCTWTTSFSGSAYQVRLSSDALQLSRQVTSASLNTTIPVMNYFTWQQVPLTIKLTWTNTSAPVKSSQTFRYQSEDFMSSGRYSGTYAPAQASGTVSDGTTNYTPAPTTSAQIAYVRSGQVTISQ
jgi:hypothetical protein